jgi:hypothetical protein
MLLLFTGNVKEPVKTDEIDHYPAAHGIPIAPTLAVFAPELYR